MSRILAEEGPLALATGLHVTIWRNGVWNGIYFGLMHAMRPPIDSGDAAADGGGGGGAFWQAIRTLGCGFGAGVIATAFNNPFDVAKSRIQSEVLLLERSSSGGSSLLGEAGIGRGLSIWRSEGISGLYAGFSAKAIRMGMGGAVGMAAYEAAARWLASSRSV